MMPRRRGSAATVAADGVASPTTAGAAVRALRGEEVLVWTSGSEQRAADGAGAPARKRLLRRGPPPGAPALLVATRARRGGVLRMHLLAEVGQSARAWPLADLRLVDGLGAPVREATDFALTFTGMPRPLLWRCESAPKRASFLWTLLQVCANRLQSRAPPSQGLSLIELQAFACEVAAAPSSRSAHSTSTAAKPPAAADGDDAHDGGSERDTTPIASGVDSGRRVVRTASDMQPGALGRLARRADHGRGRRSADGAPPAAGRDLTIHERAFLIAATRLGAAPADFAPVRSRPQSPLPGPRTDAGVEAPRSSTTVTAESPLPPPPMPRRPSGTSLRKGIDVREGGSATAMLVARCKLQEERRQFRLDDGEAADLKRALELFDADERDHSARSADGASGELSAFAAWARQRMQTIETTNMADTVQIELHPHHSKIASFRRAIVQSVDSAEPWLAPAEARLAPYAALIADIQNRARLLDRHREHAVRLRDRLAQLLDKALWTAAEDTSLASVLESMQRAPSTLISDDTLLFGNVVPVAEEFVVGKLNFPTDPLQARSLSKTSPVTEYMSAF